MVSLVKHLITKAEKLTIGTLNQGLRREGGGIKCHMGLLFKLMFDNVRRGFHQIKNSLTNVVSEACTSNKLLSI